VACANAWLILSKHHGLKQIRYTIPPGVGPKWSILLKLEKIFSR